MNKKIKVTSVAAAALASLVLSNVNLSNEVKADTKPVDATAKTTEKAQTPEEAARANVANAQKNVEIEQGNVDKAKANLDQTKKDAEKPDADYKAQSDKVASLKKIAGQKNDALTDAKNKADAAQDLANEAKDPAKVQAAKDAVTKQEGVVKKANDEKKSADQDVINKQTEIDNLGKDIKSDTQDVNDKTAAKKTADQAVTDAEKALTGTGIKEAKEAAGKAENKMNQTSSDLKGAETERDNLDKDNPELAQKISNDSKSAEDLLNQTNSSITQKDKSSRNQQQNIVDLNNELSNLKDLNEDLSKNTLQFTDIDKYKKAYVDYFTTGLSKADIDFINSERNKPINEFKHSEKDKKENIADVNNLTDEQVEELSLFMAHLINGLRHQLGWENVSVTKGSLKFAKEIAQRYIDDQRNKKWNDGLKITQTDDGYNQSTSIQANNWHDVAGINNVAKENGLEYVKKNLVYNNATQTDTGQYYEDMGDEYFDLPVTMDQLKEDLFNTIRGMVFPDGSGNTSAGSSAEYEFDHAAGVLGASEDVSDGLQKAGYLNKADRDNLEADRQWLKDDQQRLEAEIKNLAKDKAQLAEAEKNHDTAMIKLYTDAIENDDKNNIQFFKDDIKSTKKYIQEIENGHIIFVSAIPTSYKLISGIPGMNDTLFGGFHFLSVQLSYVKDKSKFDTTIIPSYVDRITSLSTKIKNANSDLNKTNQELGKLKDQAIKINQIKQAIDKVAALSQQLIDDTKGYRSAKNKYLTLTASQDDKVKKYKAALKDQRSAKDQLDTAKNALTQVNKDLATAKDALSFLKQTATEKGNIVKTEQDKLNKLKQHVEDLKNASTILADAKKAVTDAQTAYDTAKKNYDDANKVLNGDLKTNKDKADAKVATAQKAYDEAVAKLQAAKNKLAAAQQKLQDILDAEYTQSIIASSSTETQKENKQESVKTPEASKETKTDNISTAPKKIRLTHNAFIYDKHGKVLRKGLHLKWIKRDKLVKVLKSAKIVKINGKRYYQIGRNKFVKVANFEITTHTVHFKARIKGNKHIKMYNRAGKFNKHYARPNYTYTFNEKAKIHGKTYYKVAGTNSWIPAKKLVLKK